MSLVHEDKRGNRIGDNINVSVNNKLRWREEVRAKILTDKGLIFVVKNKSR